MPNLVNDNRKSLEYAKGYDDGYSAGYMCGTEDGWAKGFDAGVEWREALDQ
jgi:hypothetical protein